MNIHRVLDSLKGIKLTGGIFGKTCVLLCVLVVCFSVVVLRIATWWFGLMIMVPLGLLVFYAIKRCFDFAERNPPAAIMEGEEFLVHEKIVHGRKGHGEIPSDDLDLDHPAPLIPEPEILENDAAPEHGSERDTISAAGPRG